MFFIPNETKNRNKTLQILAQGTRKSMTLKEKIELIDKHIEELLSQPINESAIIKYTIDGVSIEKKSVFEMIDALEKMKASTIASANKLPPYIQVVI